MGENPMLELALYNAVKEFILKEGTKELWEMSVQPILRQMTAAGLASGTTALSNLGLWVEGALLTDAELIAAEAVGATALPAILKRLGINSVRAIRPTLPVVMAATIGVSIVATTVQVHAATRQMNPDNKEAYKRYVNRYIGYLLRTVAMKKNVNRYPPPMLYKQFLDRDTSGAWWQQ